MQSEEQRLIDGLFDRLKQAESQSSTRDAAAEQRIAQHLSQQPGAAYYMTQTILIQEAAMKQLNGKMQALEAQVAELEQKSRQQQSSGGFLAGLFGGGNSNSSRGSDPIPGSQNYASSAPQGNAGYGANPAPGGYSAPAGYGAPQAAPASAPRAGGGFLSGALQTAAGVAGGVVVAEMLTSMFHRSQPEEIVNIINEPAPSFDNSSFDSVNDYSQAGDRQFLSQPQDNANDYADFGNDDFGSDDYGDDDDSFI
ncbi:DUF2076 domain-containing protein [Cedecea davisae]|uniref:DUF2076 domain-containing protein n=1 Tax=Cedecea davisae TaxID=158484 RepID=A0ABS6DGI3_9ENTR|nr:DUF2076 domain-containing protein [Cedecea davisae]MBU4682298.1 DUF2076 domain-containing protein [Cedecea davisae]MBU4688512.1 DUF2076 domain-containing protein [Cedecea davisae]